MSLSFPTQAEQCLAAWREQGRTVSLGVFARKHYQAKQSREKNAQGWAQFILLTFPDDTSLRISGRGKNHCVVPLLP